MTIQWWKILNQGNNEWIWTNWLPLCVSCLGSLPPMIYRNSLPLCASCPGSFPPMIYRNSLPLCASCPGSFPPMIYRNSLPLCASCPGSFPPMIYRNSLPLCASCPGGLPLVELPPPAPGVVPPSTSPLLYLCTAVSRDPAPSSLVPMEHAKHPL
jgi:hypothetical protein